mmetsp:Transcript_66708/g.186423  ORF Transcript_66708/g.186423 Transcript_66708/m.186423 type:complete len:262 (-) Transcript_66708:509-1294(-)
MLFTSMSRACVSSFFRKASSNFASSPELAPPCDEESACKKETGKSRPRALAAAAVTCAKAAASGMRVLFAPTEYLPRKRSTSSCKVLCWLSRLWRSVATRSAFLRMLLPTFSTKALSMRRIASANSVVKAFSWTFCCSSASMPILASPLAAAASEKLRWRLSTLAFWRSTVACCFLSATSMRLTASTLLAFKVFVRCTFIRRLLPCAVGRNAPNTSLNLPRSSWCSCSRTWVVLMALDSALLGVSCSDREGAQPAMLPWRR